MMTKRVSGRWRRTLAALGAAALLAVPAAAADAPPRTAVQAEGCVWTPLRPLFEAMGWTVTWDAGKRCAAVTRNGRTWVAAEGACGLTGASEVPAGTANRIVDGRFYIPLRAAAGVLTDAMRLELAAVQTRLPEPEAEPSVPASVTPPEEALPPVSPAPQEAVPETPSETPQETPSETGGTETAAYTEDELFWLARIIEAEAGGEPMEGKIAVGNTILNRVDSDLYPDTIYGVIFDRNWGTQYTPTANGTIYNEPSADAYEAARRCLEGENLVGDCLFFLNPTIASSFWIVENREFYESIGNHDFYR